MLAYAYARAIPLQFPRSLLTSSRREGLANSNRSTAARSGHRVNPNLLNLFMKKLTRERVVPIISARSTFRF